LARKISDILLRVKGDASNAKASVRDIARDVAALDKVEGTATANVKTVGEAALAALATDVEAFGTLEATAKVDLEIKGAEAELERMKQRLGDLSRTEASPRVDIAIARAVAQIDRLELKLDKLKTKKVEVKVDVDRQDSAGAAIGGVVSSVGAGAAGAARGILAVGQGALTFFSSLAQGIPILGGVGRAFAGLGTSAVAAAAALVVIIPVVIGLVGAITLLGGAVVALGASLLSAAAGVGVLVAAFAGALGPAVLVAIAVFARFAKILEAVKKQEDGSVQSARQVRDATDRQKQAQEQLADAHRSVAATAVDALHAQRDAAEEVSDSIRGIAAAELNRDQARLNVKQAEQDLKDFRKQTGLTETSLDGLFKKFTDVDFRPENLIKAISKSGIGDKVSGGTELDLEQKILDVRSAKQQEADATDAVGDAIRRSNDAKEKEQQFNEQGLEAYAPYAAALKSVETATHAVADAQEHLTDTRADQAKVLKDLSPRERQLADVIGKVKSSLAEAFRPATDRVFGGVLNLLKQIDRFAKDAQIRNSLRGIGTAIGSVLTSFGRRLNTREFRDTFAILARGASTLIRLLGNRVFPNLLTLFLRLSRAALPPLLSIVRRIANSFGDWVKGLGQAGVQRFVDRVIRSFKIWSGLIGDIWDLFKSFFGDANDSGDKLARHLRYIVRKWTDWIEANPDGIKKFFEQSVTFAQQLFDLLNKIIPLLSKAADFATTAAEEVGLFAHPGQTAGDVADLLSGKAAKDAIAADRSAEIQANRILSDPRESKARKVGARDTLADIKRRRKARGFALGGLIEGRGTGDSQLLLGEPGEFMLRRSVAEAIGTPRLNILNSGNLGALSGGGGMTIQEQIINLPPAPGHGQLGDPRHQAAMLARELRRRGHSGVGGGGSGA
jgi:hypothetical protein